MAMTFEEYDRINSQMPKRGKGDEIEPLTEADEIALDKAWRKVADQNAKKNKQSAAKV